MSVRGWDARKHMSHDTDSYQAVCGHYIPMNQYWCLDCNIYPMSLALELEDALHKLCANGRASDKGRDIYVAVMALLEAAEAKRNAKAQ